MAWVAALVGALNDQKKLVAQGRQGLVNATSGNNQQSQGQAEEGEGDAMGGGAPSAAMKLIGMLQGGKKDNGQSTDGMMQKNGQDIQNMKAPEMGSSYFNKGSNGGAGFDWSKYLSGGK